MCSRESICPLPAQAGEKCATGVSNPYAPDWLLAFPCLSLHVDRDGIAKAGGIETIMHDTGYSRGAVCSALEYLESAGSIRRLRRHHGADEYATLGCAWFGRQPVPALWE